MRSLKILTLKWDPEKVSTALNDPALKRSNCHKNALVLPSAKSHRAISSLEDPCLGSIARLAPVCRLQCYFGQGPFLSKIANSRVWTLGASFTLIPESSIHDCNSAENVRAPPRQQGRLVKGVASHADNADD